MVPFGPRVPVLRGAQVALALAEAGLVRTASHDCAARVLRARLGRDVRAAGVELPGRVAGRGGDLNAECPAIRARRARRTCAPSSSRASTGNAYAWSCRSCPSRPREGPRPGAHDRAKDTDSASLSTSVGRGVRTSPPECQRSHNTGTVSYTLSAEWWLKQLAAGGWRARYRSRRAVSYADCLVPLTPERTCGPARPGLRR